MAAIEILYFARVREAIGEDGESVQPPDSVKTVGELADWLAARGGGYAEAFADRAVLRAAVDRKFVDFDHPVAGAAEIAFFPPVTGG